MAFVSNPKHNGKNCNRLCRAMPAFGSFAAIALVSFPAAQTGSLAFVERQQYRR